VSTAASNDPRVEEVRVTRDQIIAHLVDGRVIGVPLSWSWRLSEATPEQRANFRITGLSETHHPVVGLLADDQVDRTCECAKISPVTDFSSGLEGGCV